LVFAATPVTVDKCTEKFEACKTSCGIQQSQCNARGSDPGECTGRFRSCQAECSNDLKTCQAKSGTKPAPSPTPKAPKKPAKT
jgi:hypothetical protein